eukprot:TRINITY_DN8279_c0_g1_i2.p1 TRINITY_DN8279_c0_g1~~TRINITY_DN8279_c0_g1_i2.p1  ORF type:complete len:208 (-),score=52.22 TRINITY_DN8279_c0_g1_i2:573-1196(-)
MCIRDRRSPNGCFPMNRQRSGSLEQPPRGGSESDLVQWLAGANTELCEVQMKAATSPKSTSAEKAARAALQSEVNELEQSINSNRARLRALKAEPSSVPSAQPEDGPANVTKMTVQSLSAELAESRRTIDALLRKVDTLERSRQLYETDPETAWLVQRVAELEQEVKIRDVRLIDERVSQGGMLSAQKNHIVRLQKLMATFLASRGP